MVSVRGAVFMLLQIFLLYCVTPSISVNGPSCKILLMMLFFLAYLHHLQLFIISLSLFQILGINIVVTVLRWGSYNFYNRLEVLHWPKRDEAGHSSGGKTHPKGSQRSVTRPPRSGCSGEGGVGPARDQASARPSPQACLVRRQGETDGLFSLYRDFLKPQLSPSLLCSPPVSLPSCFMECPRPAGDRTRWEAADRPGILLGGPRTSGLLP